MLYVIGGRFFACLRRWICTYSSYVSDMKMYAILQSNRCLWWKWKLVSEVFCYWSKIIVASNCRRLICKKKRKAHRCKAILNNLEHIEHFCFWIDLRTKKYKVVYKVYKELTMASIICCLLNWLVNKFVNTFCFCRYAIFFRLACSQHIHLYLINFTVHLDMDLWAYLSLCQHM